MARQDRQKKKVGYAVVGLGYFAQAAVLPAFAHARSNSRLVALVSGDAKKQRALKQRYKVPVFGYEALEECLAMPEVDAVYLVLPNHLHLEYVERAARAGAHVLCEKPLGLSEAECLRMISVCEESDVRLMTGYRLHFEPANLLAVETLRKGQIGEPRLFSSSFSYQVKPENIRVDREKGGGPLWDIGIYCINASRYLFRDEPTEAFAFAAQGDEERFAEVEEGLSANLRFPGDKLASFNVSFGAARSGEYSVVGTKGSIHVEDAYEFTGGKQVELYVGEKRKWSRKVKAADHVAAELTYFSDCVLEGRQPEPDGHEGLADVRIIRALYQSAEEGRAVKLEPFDRTRRPTGEQKIVLPPSRAPDLVEASEPN